MSSARTVSSVWSGPLGKNCARLPKSSAAATAARAEYTGSDDALVLTGTPQVADGGMQIAAQRIRLLRTSGDTGHGMGTPLDAEIDEDVDVYGFLFRELGMGSALGRSPG